MSFSPTLVLAGLMGAAGVVLQAMAAHVTGGASLASAGLMLLVHALAVIGTEALVPSAQLSRPVARIAVWGWILGALVFAGDIGLRTYVGHRLFPMAAPAGGSLMILAWLAFAVAAVLPRRQ